MRVLRALWHDFFMYDHLVILSIGQAQAIFFIGMFLIWGVPSYIAVRRGNRK